MLSGALALLFGAGLRALAALASALPTRLADDLGRLLGWGWYRLVPIRRRVARANVALAFGETLSPADREALVAAHFAHLGRSFVEFLRFAGRPAARLLASGTIEVEGREHLERALTAGRGALILAAHLGNFELLVRLGALAGRPSAVVTRRFAWAPAERAWRHLRRGGPILLPAGGSARAMLTVLRENGLVAFVLDQHSPSRRAVRVPFFGRPAATSPDLVRLARLAGAPVVPIFTRRCGDRHLVVIEPPVPVPTSGDAREDVVAGTALCTARIEAAIRRAPEQWLWIHRRWKPARAATRHGAPAPIERTSGAV